MLRFILGAGGTGKTAYIYDKIKELVLSDEEEVLLLVPDQSTFETEKAFLELLGAHLCGRVSVFGFDGMCRRVFSKTHNVPVNVIDNGTRAVLMNIALEQVSDKLRLLKTKRSRAISDMLLGTLSECKKSGVTTEMLRRAAGNIGDETLSGKLDETALVLDAFDALLSQSYIDPLDDLDRLQNILLENNELFRNRVLFVDSFSGFTSVQLGLIRILLSRCREVNVALTLDPGEDDNDGVFQVSNITLKQLKDIAKRDNVEIKAPVKLSEPCRFENPDLAVLERGIFRHGDHACGHVPKGITLYRGGDLYDECAFVARRIKELVLKHGMRYKDISVICRDSKSYRGILDVTLEKYDIPYFMDVSRDVGVKPVVRFVNCVFRLITDGFQREDLLALLKTGLTRHSVTEISALENYLYIWNLSGRQLHEPFTLNPRGFAEEFKPSDEKALARLEEVRRSVIEPLLSFREEIKGQNGRCITEKLYRLLEAFGVPDALSGMYDALEQNEKGLGAEQIRVWGLLMDALDKTVAVVGDNLLTAERYFELLTIQISNIEFSQIPQTLDCVTVTTAQRVRIGKQKAVFLIGCAEGEFPAVPRVSGLFSGYEIRQLHLNEINISDDFSYLVNLETFFAYSALTAPSHLLFVSFSALSLEGEKKKPSVIFDEIKKVFPKLPVLDKWDHDERADSMLAIKPAFEEYARSLSEHREELRGLGEFFADNPYYQSGSRAVRRAVAHEPFRIEEPENARLLFGENLTVSASQIEKFSLCRFSYFCNYGLGIRERRRAEINPMEYGTLVHAILERFFTQYSKKEYSAMTEEQIAAFIRETVAAYLEGYFGGSETKQKSFLYRLDMLCSNLILLLSHIIAELCQSDFEVADCELKINGDIPAYTVVLPSGQSVAVCGSVDRVDIMKTGDAAYLRIIDYKTGSKTFKLSDILYGLNLQMLLYLCSIQREGKPRYGDVTPAGILYMPAVVPNILADGLSEEAVQKVIDKDFRMNGLLLDDVRVIKGMDKSESAKYIPVKIKNGENVKCDSLATLAQFGEIFRKLNSTVARMGELLFDGDIQAVPLTGAADSCKYCPYDSVCGYRRGEPKTVFGLPNDEVFKELEEENGGED